MIVVKFQGALTTLDVKDTINHWAQRNKCGRCRLGPCMCAGVTDTSHKIISAGKSVPGMSYKGMAYTDPIARRMIDADTEAFCKEMQAEVKAGVERRRRNEET